MPGQHQHQHQEKPWKEPCVLIGQTSNGNDKPQVVSGTMLASEVGACTARYLSVAHHTLWNHGLVGKFHHHIFFFLSPSSRLFDQRNNG
jgi:hypothetical protein